MKDMQCIVATVNHLSVRPGDVVAITFHNNPPVADLVRFKGFLAAAFPDLRFIVINAGGTNVDYTLISKEVAESVA